MGKGMWAGKRECWNTEMEDINEEDVKTALKKSHKWRSPVINKLLNFWLSALSSTHKDLAFLLTDVVKNPGNAPAWSTKGITYLLPKSGKTQHPKNYRPITCLSTTYKTLTSILTDCTYIFLENNNLLPTEQKGCRRGSYGCKDLLLIEKMVLEHCNSNTKNLSAAWIDYKKAFDSIPHDWIIKAMKMYTVTPEIINFVKISMKTWKTTLILNHGNGSITSNNISINGGIFQGDSFFLLFCIDLFP